MELWELVIPICDWFILIWSQGLVPRRVHTERFVGQVPATSPTNSNQFELVGLYGRRTKFRSLRLDFVAKMASSHDATSPYDLLQGQVHGVYRPLNIRVPKIARYRSFHCQKKKLI